jgi:hypothetical protein
MGRMCQQQLRQHAHPAAGSCMSLRLGRSGAAASPAGLKTAGCCA